MESPSDRTVSLARLADSYLDHIRIAVEAGDIGGPFRDFIDNWAAYASEADHHRNSRDRVVWFNNPDAIARRSMLLSLPFRSAGADAILRLAQDRPDEYRSRQAAKDRSVRLIVDHAVPLAVLKTKLFEPGTDLSRDGLRSLLGRFYHLGLLDHAEDARLNALGLRSRMPENWDGSDLVARYQIAGLSENFSR